MQRRHELLLRAEREKLVAQGQAAAAAKAQASALGKQLQDAQALSSVYEARAKELARELAFCNEKVAVLERQNQYLAAEDATKKREMEEKEASHVASLKKKFKKDLDEHKKLILTTVQKNFLGDAIRKREKTFLSKGKKSI